MTPGGVGYELLIPLGVLESLPRVGDDVSLHTAMVVKEDGWQLFGFESQEDRALFYTLLGASGVGPSLALGLISALGVGRLARALVDRDIATLQGVPRVGKKTAERLCVELGDKMRDFAKIGGAGAVVRSDAGSADAVRALQALGYTTLDAEKAVREAVGAGSQGNATSDVIRQALALLQKR
jgi:Holliday junction DNA helicase RuvA